MPTPPKPEAIPDTLRHFDFLPNAAHVRQPIVERLFACSSATVWRRVKDGRIPKPRKLSDRVTDWNVGALRRACKESEANHDDQRTSLPARWSQTSWYGQVVSKIPGSRRQVAVLVR